VATGIDDARVERWFVEHVGVQGPLEFTQVLGGHSCLTFFVDTPDGARFVLRRPPVGQILRSAHDVVREHTAITALADTDVPVAPVRGLCIDLDVTGAPFYVMDFVPGFVLHDRAAAEAVDPAARRRAAESMIEVLVALQSIDPDDVGLGELGRPTDYLGRQLRRWRGQWEQADTRPMPRMSELYDWLEANQPEEGPAGIVHGDFRLGNAIHHEDGSVAALLDWELCTLGPRNADLSYLLRSWDSGEASGASAVASSAPGFPDRDGIVAYYEAVSGRPVDHLDYWMAFHAYRSACIVAGVFTRYKHGQLGEPTNDFAHFEDAVETGMLAGLDAAGIR
jgi:aminoglycoside phosphotransferase (APT) family kinase protein